MNIQHGFLSTAVLIGITLGLIIVGSGLYYVTKQQTSLSTLSENNLDNLSENESPATTSNSISVPTNTDTKYKLADWNSVTATGLTIKYPATLKILSNINTPIVHLEFEEVGEVGPQRVFVSAANIIPANEGLKNWLESYNYFNTKYRSHEYVSYKRKDGVEILASLGNESSYDDAFIRLGNMVVYVKNGVSESAKVSDSDFQEIIEQIKLPNSLNLEVPTSGYSCLTGSDDLMTLYWGTLYRQTNPSIPFIYSPGSYCESADGSKLMTMAYFFGELSKSEQAIISFDKGGKIINSFKGQLCSNMGDLGTPHILSADQEKLSLFCLNVDAGMAAFSVYEAPITTLVPVEVKPGTVIYNNSKTAVKKLYDIDF